MLSHTQAVSVCCAIGSAVLVSVLRRYAFHASWTLVTIEVMTPACFLMFRQTLLIGIIAYNQIELKFGFTPVALSLASDKPTVLALAGLVGFTIIPARPTLPAPDGLDLLCNHQAHS